MLAARISFMNEIARLCELLGANIEQVRKGIGTDSRIGFPFLFPGPGYGGSCFPKDVQALIRTGNDVGCDLKLARAVEDVNAAQKHRLAEKVVAKFGPKLDGKTFCIWGLAFKPNTDDVREAPALVVIEDLLARGAKIHATDPEAIETTRRILGDRIKYFDKNYDALTGADALLLVTEWNEYRRPNFSHIKEKLRTPVIFDGRNVYDRKSLESQGFEYHGIGL
jgi:UDPglucose 6-dehydrogenase